MEPIVPTSAQHPPQCPACLSTDGRLAPVILVFGWCSSEVPPGPYSEAGRCWRCGAAAVYVVTFRVAPEEELARWQ
jgi:hypothetical protein